MTDLTETPEVQAVVAKIQKMLKLAAKNPNEHEAAAATAKAQEMLARYNLSMSQVERAKGKDGTRAKELVKGGFYHWQRDLWYIVAQLHFCLYWTSEVRTPYQKRYEGADGNFYYRTAFKWQHHHKMVGRTVNLAAAQVLAQYLEEAVERVTRDNVPVDDLFSNYGNSFREGCVSTVVQALNEKRRHLVSEDRRRKEEAARRAREAGLNGSASMAVTLSTYIDEETDANNDFIHGKGWSAEQAALRAKRAAEAQRREAEYTAWAAAHPEEAAKKEAEAAKQRRGGYGRQTYADTKKWDAGAYYRGQAAGKNISVDQQVDGGPKGFLK